MTATARLSPRVAALIAQRRANRGRLVFALDATASREPTWDLAAQLQVQMFEEAAKIGNLDVQLLYYRGDEVRASAWSSDAVELMQRMREIRCMAGATKIAQVLEHIQQEDARAKVSAAIFIGDAVEEPPTELYDAAADLSVPLFVFQEGDGPALCLDPGRWPPAPQHPPQTVEQVFRELARLTGGAYGKFDAGAAKQLGELLRAVAAFAVGGVKALANQRTDSARLLLRQLK
jgi:hypothetical protein